MADFATIAAITAGATSALSAITSLLPTAAKDGVVGNWADRILLVSLLQGKVAWQCFRRNCGRLDQKENHLLYRSLLEAHWRAVAQAAAGCARAQGFRVATAADALPLPRGMQDLVARAQLRWLPEEVEAEAGHLRRLVQVCEERSRAAVPPSEWATLLDPLYDDLTLLVEQGRRPTLGPTEQAWKALEAEFPDACGSLGFRAFFAEHWFDCFLVEFQSLVQRPEVAPLLMGKLFAEIREREQGPALDPARILSALTGMEERIVGEVRAGSSQISAQLAEVERNILEKLDERKTAAVREPLINVPNAQSPIVGRDREARRLLAALAETGPGALAVVAPPGFGKTALFAQALALGMPSRNPQELGLNGMAVLDARQGPCGIAELAALLGRITGWQETAAAFGSAGGEQARTLFFDFLRQAGPVWLVIENAERALLPEISPEFAALVARVDGAAA